MFKERSYCGELNDSDIGKKVTIAGWVDRKRDLGGIVFIELRDVSGIMQVVFDSSHSKENADLADSTRNEFVITVCGKVRKRSEDTINENVPTGFIEIVAETIEVLSESLVAPIPIDIREQVGEDVRLKYRFLDLRREDMKDSIIKRHSAMQTTRRYLCENRFYEIETPVLNKSTPEGARDFLVPSRINKGQFYALPQSPQLFKQILMVAGFDRYFQIVKCFRDEDLRNDRQPEFTQIDLELSFVNPDMIMEVVEGLLMEIVKDVTGRDIELPFQRMPYAEVMDKYCTDAPDMRISLEVRDCTDIFKDSEFNVFRNAVESGGVVKAIAVPDSGKISRKIIDDYSEYVKVFGAGGFPMFKYGNGKKEGGISKFISDDELKTLLDRLDAEEPCMIFFSADTVDIVNMTMSRMREKLAADAGLVDEDSLAFLWVHDFPLFEFHDEDKRFYSVHHPFTAPDPDCIGKLDSLEPGNADEFKSQSYDVVLNGVEIGGGSIRINRHDLQNRIFSILGISHEEANEKFSFLLEALQYGAPPHGGIALGLDRILMILLNKNSIRDVIPFPKTQKGQCLMSRAPSPVSDQQLRELSLKVLGK
jgi:aspartyl-tRNA synthetase